jgi:hypothetical protein
MIGAPPHCEPILFDSDARNLTAIKRETNLKQHSNEDC